MIGARKDIKMKMKRKIRLDERERERERVSEWLSKRKREKQLGWEGAKEEG